MLPWNLKKIAREYVFVPYADIRKTVKFAISSGALFSAAEWSVESGRRLFLQHFTYSCIWLKSFIHNHRSSLVLEADYVFVHFVSTEDYPEARSSLETKREASQRADGMTKDHEGTCS